jgi:hypothetical protein
VLLDEEEPCTPDDEPLDDELLEVELLVDDPLDDELLEVELLVDDPLDDELPVDDGLPDDEPDCNDVGCEDAVSEAVLSPQPDNDSSRPDNATAITPEILELSVCTPPIYVCTERVAMCPVTATCR